MRARRFLILVISASGLAQITLCQQPAARRVWTCEPDPERHVPYSAEFTLTDVKPGPNGTLITYNYSEMQSLDSHGRTLDSVTFPDPMQKGPARVTGGTCDPVSNTQMQWDSRLNRVTVLAMPKPEQRQGCWESERGDFTIDFESPKLSRASSTVVHQPNPDATFDNQPKPTVDDLGEVSIQGVKALGTRTTGPPASGQPASPNLLI